MWYRVLNPRRAHALARGLLYRLLAAGSICALTLLLTASTVLARGGHGGGGGRGFGGGGFSGGYHGGFGGGFGGGYFPIPLFFGGGGGTYGFLFLLLLLFTLYQIYRRTSLGTPTTPPAASWSGSAPAAPAPPVDESVVAEGRAALQAKDPNFSEQAFLDRARTIFFALQKAWMERNLEPVRPYMSDGLYTRWKMQVEAMTALRKKNIIEELAIAGIRMVSLHSGEDFDSITTRIDASCMDYEVNEDTGASLFGSRDVMPFTEYWTFIRSAAAGTQAGEAAEAAVTDWVLDNITQAADWQG